MKRYIIGYKYRRMAHQNETKCRIPFYFIPSDEVYEALSCFNPKVREDAQKGETFYSSWMELPFNSVFDLEEGQYEGFAKVKKLRIAEDVDWTSLPIYVQPFHFQSLPERYQVLHREDGEGYGIGRFNFRYNSYAWMNKGTFSTEAEAQKVIDEELDDWE